MRQHAQRLTPDQYEYLAQHRMIATVVAVVLINSIAIPAIIWWSWFGFAVQSVGIVVLVLWQEFANRRDRLRTDWGEVEQVHA
jgi:hypothetical protein